MKSASTQAKVLPRRSLPLALLLSALPLLAAAQPYPAKPLRLVVAFPPGGGADVVARAVATKMSEPLGQPVVVENRGGASGNIGTDAVAKSAPDGYTLLLGTAANVINTAGGLKLNHDFLRDFAPVVLFVKNQNVLVAHPSVPAANAKELIALARAKPGALNYGSYGNGSSSHLAGELFRQLAQVSVTHVPYKGAAPAITDLIAGQVQLVFADVAVALQHIRAGKLRAMALGSPKRFEGLADVPTFEESGLTGYEAGGFLGLMAPAGTPPAIVSRLNDAAVKSLAANDLRERLIGLGATPIGGTPAEFGVYLKAEIDKWTRVIKAGGISLDQ
jgi:tripartite-type tricarboxylate transporter receptor subunit TctC